MNKNDDTAECLEKGRLNMSICLYDHAFAEIDPLIEENNKEVLEMGYEMLFDKEVSCGTDMEKALKIIRHKVGRENADAVFNMLDRLYSDGKILG